MGAFLALLAMLQTSGLAVQRVAVPGPEGVTLDAALIWPAGAARGTGVVALHGCGGPFPDRDGQWAVALARAGHTVLLPDSFGSRGLGSQCGTRDRAVTSSGLRRRDAIAAASWLAAQRGVPAGGVALLGWSDGGSTVLATAKAAPDVPRGLVRSFVALYPGCGATARSRDWRPLARGMILIGEADDWTPAAPCREVAARFSREIAFVVYPGAYHDFDAPGRPVRVRSGTASTASGTAHVGTNEPARQDALARVPAFLAGK